MSSKADKIVPEPRSFADIIRQDYLGQPLAIWCARYTYRGIVKEVGSDFVTFSNPRAVEATGEASGSTPTREDPIPSDVVISIGSVEQFCQPAWVWHNLEADKDVKAGKIRSFADVLREDYINQPLAIWCARYTYRGIVKEVGSDFVTFSNPRAVEATGEASGSTPTREDPIPSDLTISIGSVEQFCQPGWVSKDLEVENSKEKAKQK